MLCRGWSECGCGIGKLAGWLLCVNGDMYSFVGDFEEICSSRLLYCQFRRRVHPSHGHFLVVNDGVWVVEFELELILFFGTCGGKVQYHL